MKTKQKKYILMRFFADGHNRKVDIRRPLMDIDEARKMSQKYESQYRKGELYSFVGFVSID